MSMREFYSREKLANKIPSINLFAHLRGSRDKPLSHPIKTIGQVCRQQGQKLIEELILLAHDRLLQGQSADEVFSRLFAKQHKEVPA